MREKEIQKGDDLATAVIIAQRAEQEERVLRMELERVAAGLEALYDLNADWLALHAHPNNAHRKKTVTLGGGASIISIQKATLAHFTPFFTQQVILLYPSVPYRTIVTR
jgi:hypothetical protein